MRIANQRLTAARHNKGHLVLRDITRSLAGITKRLHPFTRNLWWSWNPHAQAIFRKLSPAIWEATNHNPVAVLKQFSEVELKARLGDRVFCQEVIEVLASFDGYMEAKSKMMKGWTRHHAHGPIAYFCAEFGVHESLPFYSGGLGILAGDHVKSASDLGVPLVAIGLFYKQGYFQQQMDSSGYQQERYPTTNPMDIPVELVQDAAGKPLLCSVTIGNSVVSFQGWRLNVGLSVIFLLDTDIPENAEHFRGLTALAYGGDVNMRIRQEIVLGIGGVRFLRAQGIHPTAFHMNEGHAAFLTLELLQEQMRRGIPLQKAEQAVRAKCLFTTHTPVAAGHDRFPVDLVQFTLRPYMDTVGVSMPELMEYGQSRNSSPKDEFTMTILGLKLSRAANGVSGKHAEISRLMWSDLYPNVKPKNVPIGHITNGIHVPSWTTRASWEFWERHNSHKWKEHLYDPKFWKHVADPAVVTDEEIWALRYQLRRELVEFVRRQARHGHVAGALIGGESLNHLLSTDALTIGFARRFAPYKRAPMLFSDPVRAQLLFSDPQRPIQIIYAGKAHPRDAEGKELLRQIIDIARQNPFSGKVVFLENYDMNIARHLVAGCDVWLNTPRRPLEASGTSGQKIAINGGLHLSVLDGWWLEGYNGKNGWAIGHPIEDDLSPEQVDKRDAESLYHVLTNDVIPMFYQRDKEGIPRKWIARIRNAMESIIPVYNTHRMVMEYADKYYYPKR